MAVTQSEHIRRAIALRDQRPLAVKFLDWIRSRPEGGIAVLFFLVQLTCIVAALLWPDSFRYLSEANIAVTLKAIAPLGIMALGVGVLMIAGEYDLSNGSDDFAPFTDGLLSDAGLPARSSAQQHSSPQLDATGSLAGASADGSARAAVVTDIVDAFSTAETDFDLVFRVDGKSSTFTFDGTLAASGDASSGVLLHPKDDADAPPLFSVDAAGETRAVHQSTVLEPGTYGLSVWAFARGTPDASEASYTLSVSLKDGEPGVVPMPLPAAAGVGLIGLAAVGLLTYKTRARKAATGQ